MQCYTDVEAIWIDYFDSDFIDSDVFIASYCVVSPYMYNLTSIICKYLQITVKHLRYKN